MLTSPRSQKTNQDSRKKDDSRVCVLNNYSPLTQEISVKKSSVY